MLPPAGYMKINTDASVRMEQGRVSYGGIVRDDIGNWILGYYGFIGKTKITEAELWSIHQGLKITKDKDWKQVIIETDSQAAMNLLQTQILKITHWES